MGWLMVPVSVICEEFTVAPLEGMSCEMLAVGADVEEEIIAPTGRRI